MTKYYTYILYLLISILVVLVYVNGFGPIDGLQRSVNDFLCRTTAKEGARPNVVLVKIDGRSLDEHGNWPWNRDLLADLMAATASGEPRAIVLDVNLPENASQDSLGYNDILAGQLSWIENAVLPYDIALATYRAQRTSNPKYLFPNSIEVENPLGLLDDDAALLARKVFLPAEKLLASRPHLGFVYDAPDEDRILRREPLVMHYEGYYYPSLTLAAAATWLKVPFDQIKVVENQEIQLGTQRLVPINDRSEFFVNFTSGSAFTEYSAADILGTGFNYDQLKNKLVLIGVDHLNAYEFFDTPAQKQVTGLFVKASVIENIINDNILVEKAGSPALDMLIMFLIGGLFAFLLPRVSLGHRMMILGGAMLVLVNLTYFMLSSFGMIAETLYIALELSLFMVAAPMLDSQLLTGEVMTAGKPKGSTTPKAAAMSKAEPHIIGNDSADVPVREIKASEVEQEDVETMAVSYNKNGEFADHQAISLDDDMDMDEGSGETSATSLDPSEITLNDEPDYTEPPKAKASQPTIISADNDQEPVETPSPKEPERELSDSEKTAILSDTGRLKNLGRYQILDVLGKGAMGLVYKGVDPAINRPVALKTIRLDFVNDPEEMEELKERLHREAQAAGKLSHPNIVTIYDVGSEGQLQYIAMEFLEGQTLEDMIKKKTKFNYRIIAQIILQICNALEYAHQQGIIHRDIKPANIMILKDYRVKVMDYGIARIDSNSMTKTGIAMGTPNYISPEQLKGLRPDRRGDIFSLGVVMYEMLLGRRPFKGENITSLIYSIMHTEPEKPSVVNPQIPLIFDHIIEKSLKKDPGERYQKASEIQTDMKDFVEAFTTR